MATYLIFIVRENLQTRELCVLTKYCRTVHRNANCLLFLDRGYYFSDIEYAFEIGEPVYK